MAFADIFNTVNAQLTAIVTDAGHSALVPSYAFGPTATRERNAPPRLGWNFQPEKYLWNRNTRPSFPRSLLTRTMSFQLDLWGPCQQISPMFVTGSGLGTVTVTGAPVLSTTPTTYGLSFQIVVSGALGTATFKYSTDSGLTWSSTIATAASVVLGSTGLTAAFSGSFQIGDQFWCVANDYPQGDFATTEWLLNALLCAIHQSLFGNYEIVGGLWLNQGSSDTVQDGKAYQLILNVEMPVIEMTSPRLVNALVTSVPQTDIIGSTSTTP